MPSLTDPSPAQQDRLAGLEREISGAEQAASEGPLIAQRAPTTDETVRSWIANGVIFVFILTTGSAVGCIAALGGTSGHWDVATADTLELLRSVVLPVVTLVLGYYFGRSGRI